MAIAERINFLVSVDTAGAEAGFRSLAGGMTAAEAKTKEAQAQASSLMSFGAKALVVAGVMGAGLWAASKAASNLQESLNFANREFGNSTKIVDDFAKHAATSAGLSEAAALQAAAGYAALGKAAGVSGDDLAHFSVNMTQLAADLASLRNTSLDDATSALTSALRGRYVAISKYGIIINDAILKQEAFNEGTYSGTGKLDAQARILATYNIVMKESTAAQGDFARTSGNIANQQRILSANFENFKAGIGQGVIPIFTKLISGANAALGAFNGLDSSTKSAVGGFATWATVAIGAVGAISLVAGSVIKMKAALTDGAGGLNAFGKAAKGMGLAIAAFGAVDTAFGVINDINNISMKASDNLKALAIASRGSSQDILTAFGKLAKTKDDTFQWSHLWEDFGQKITVVGTKGARDINDLNRAFDDLLKQSPQQAQDLVNAMKDQLSTLDPLGSQYKDNTKLIEAWQKRIDLTTGSQQAMTDETKNATDAIQQQADETKTINKSLSDMASHLDDLSISQQVATAGATAFEDTWKAVPFDEIINSTLDLRDANDQFFMDMKKAKPVLDQNLILHGKLSDAQKTTTKDLTDLSDKMQAYVKSLLDGGMSADDAAVKMGQLRDSFTQQGKAAGLTDKQVQDYLTTLGLTPDQVTTLLRVAGDAEAKDKVKTYIALLGDIDPETGSEIVTLLNEGKYDEAATRLADLAATRTATYNVKVNPVTYVPGVPGLTGSTGGGFGGTGYGTSYVTINVPPTLNPQSVVRAFRSATSRNGALARG